MKNGVVPSGSVVVSGLTGRIALLVESAVEAMNRVSNADVNTA